MSGIVTTALFHPVGIDPYSTVTDFARFRG
jgi:hypothetical protein